MSSLFFSVSCATTAPEASPNTTSTAAKALKTLPRTTSASTLLPFTVWFFAESTGPTLRLNGNGLFWDAETCNFVHLRLKE
jgi:hypothetical protein